MATQSLATDAQLCDLICLKQPPSAPKEPWQLLATRQHTSVSQSCCLTVRAPVHWLSTSARTYDIHRDTRLTHYSSLPLPFTGYQQNNPEDIKSLLQRGYAVQQKEKNSRRQIWQDSREKSVQRLPLHSQQGGHGHGLQSISGQKRSVRGGGGRRVSNQAGIPADPAQHNEEKPWNQRAERSPLLQSHNPVQRRSKKKEKKEAL